MTIDGYRPTIDDRLGNSPINVSRMKILLVSWIVSTETDPKDGWPGGGGHNIFAFSAVWHPASGVTHCFNSF